MSALLHPARRLAFPPRDWALVRVRGVAVATTDRRPPARDIAMSARLFKADEALAMGLVNYVESEGDIYEAVAAYAERIASNAPLIIRAARAAISDVMLEASKRDRPGVQALIDACFDSEDYREGRRVLLKTAASV